MARIVSVQPFEITIGLSQSSNTATISAVTTGKSAIFWGGSWSSNNISKVLATDIARIELTNSTTVTAYRNTASPDYTVTITGTIVEFGDFITKTLNGTVSSSVTNQTQAISSIDSSKSVIMYCGVSTDEAAGQYTRMPYFVINSDTEIELIRNSAGSNIIAAYSIIEFASEFTKKEDFVHTTADVAGSVPYTLGSSFDLSNSILFFSGATGNNGNFANVGSRIGATSSTEITSTRNNSGNTNSRTTAGSIVEFPSGVLASVQRSDLNNTTTATSTAFSPVDLTKSFLNIGGFSYGNNGFSARFLGAAKLLTDSTLELRKGVATASVAMNWEVIEFAEAVEANEAEVIYTQDNNVLSSAADVDISAISNINQANNTLSSASSVSISASAAITQANNTLSCAATVNTTAQSSYTQPNNTLSSSVSVEITAQSNITQEGDSLSATAGTESSATCEFTQADNTLSANANVGIEATANITQEGDNLSSAAVVGIAASVSYTQDDNTLSAEVTVGDANTASVTYTQNDQTLDSYVEVSGQQDFGGGLGDYYKYRKKLELLVEATRQKEITKEVKQAAKVIAKIPVKTPQISKIANEKIVAIDYEKINNELTFIYEHVNKRIDEYEALLEQEDELIILMVA